MDLKSLLYAPLKVLAVFAFLAMYGNALLAGQLLAPAFTPSVLYTAYAAPAVAVAVPPPVSVPSPSPPTPSANLGFQQPLLPITRPFHCSTQVATAPVASVGLGIALNVPPALSAPISTSPTEIIPASCPPSSICHYPLPAMSEVAAPPDCPPINDGRPVGQPPLQPANGLLNSDVTQLHPIHAAQIVQPQITTPKVEAIRHSLEELPYKPQLQALNVLVASRPKLKLTSTTVRGPMISSNFPLCPNNTVIGQFSPLAALPTSTLAEAPIMLNQTLLTYLPCLTASPVFFADPTQTLLAASGFELLASQASAPTVAAPSLPSAAFLPPEPSPIAVPTPSQYASVPLTVAYPSPAPTLLPATVAQRIAPVPSLVSLPGQAAYVPSVPAPTAIVSYASVPAAFVTAPYPTAYSSHKQQAHEELARDSNYQNIGHSINYSDNSNNIKRTVGNDKPITELPSTVNGVHLPAIRK